MIGEELMLGHALFAEQERGFMHCADEVSGFVVDLAVPKQDHFLIQSNIIIAKW